jgi:hypothetical protein
VSGFDSAREQQKNSQAALLTIQEAARRCGVSPATFNQWTKHGCPWLNGRRIPTTPDHGATMKRLFLVERADVNDIVSAMNSRHDEYFDGKVKYISAAAVTERFGFRHDSLSVWSLKGCPALGGRKLPRRRQRLSAGGRGRNKRQWFYPESDLQVVAAGKGSGDVVAVASSAPVERSREAVQPPKREDATDGNGQEAPEAAETEIDLEALRATLPPLGSERTAAPPAGNRARCCSRWRHVTEKWETQRARNPDMTPGEFLIWYQRHCSQHRQPSPAQFKNARKYRKRMTNAAPAG